MLINLFYFIILFIFGWSVQGSIVKEENIRTALWEATVVGDILAIKRLLEAGVPVNLLSDEGETPLHWAVDWQNIKLAKVLMEAGANVNQLSHNKKKESPFHRAINRGGIEMIKALIEFGADLNKVDSNGETPLHRAVSDSDFELIKLLIESGANLEQLNEEGESILETALSNNELEIIKYIIKNKISIDFSDVKLRKMILQSIRSGDLALLHAFQQQKDLQAFLEKESFYGGRYATCLNTDSLESLNFEDLRQEPLTVVQNFCNSIIELKDGNLLKLQGQNAETLYHYLQEKLKIPHGKKSLSKLTVYLNPGHAFLAIEHQDKHYLLGLYPNELSEKSSGDEEFVFWVQRVVLSSSFSFLCSVYLKKWNLSIGLASTAIGLGFSFLSDFIKTYWNPIHYKLGLLMNEAIEERLSNDNNYLLLSFILEDEQASAALNYIENVKKDCRDSSMEFCTYHVLSRNCLSFVQEVLNAAGFKSHFSKFFEDEQLDHVDYSSFEGLYNTKALLYAQLLKQYY